MKIILLLLAVLILLSKPKTIYAQSDRKYITIVTPVRSRDKWLNQKILQKQMSIILDSKLPSTWLLTYSVLEDEHLIAEFKKFPSNQEFGVFLEVSENLADTALVPYLYGEGDWARADKVLFSGYAPDERMRMADKIFESFKETFGYYPRSIGAWYIDTLTLNYLKDKYNIKSMMDVADQYITDTYGVWGKPWGTPYIPSKYNSIIPAQNELDNSQVVKIQWAMRDLDLGYGTTVDNSTHSVQANDYLRHNLDIDYFKYLTSVYLTSSNMLNQLTVGLEYGQEGIKFYSEFEKQINYLRNISEKNSITFLTMTDFAKVFTNTVESKKVAYFLNSISYNQPEIEIYWYMSNKFRVGFIKKNSTLYLRDLKIYSQPYVFLDILEKDISHILKRYLPSILDTSISKDYKKVVGEIENIKVERQDNSVRIKITNHQSEIKLLYIEADNIRLDDEFLFIIPKTTKIFDSLKFFLVHQLNNILIHQSSIWKPKWIFTRLDKTFFFGINMAPELLYGFKSEYPYFGKYYFPFQTISHFLNIPGISLRSTIFKNFIKWINLDTIHLTESIQI